MAGPALPCKGSVLNYYEGVYLILQLIPPMVSSLTIEADSSLQQSLLHPDHSKWAMRFQARRLHAMITNYEQVNFSVLHPQTVRISKLISRNSGNSPMNIDNMDILYNSIRHRA